MTDYPPIEWFRSPELTELTPLTVTPEGRVFGHVAGWSTDHLSFPGRRIRPPHSASDYSHFHVGVASVRDGDEVREISVGRLSMNTGHAGTELGHKDTSAWYDNTGAVAAVCCVGEDEVGIWFSGSLMPDLDEMSRRRFQACALSGDWRRVGSGGLELVAVLSVSTPGFAIPRARVASGAPLALVAAGMVQQPAAFGRRVAEGWVAPKVEAPALDVDSLADALAVKLDQRRVAGELAARHTALVSELDDTPILAAALLAEIDDSPQRAAALLAELDESDDFNWVEDAGGLPSYIKRIADHLKTDGMDESRAIATAVNAAKKMCSTGDTNFPGKQQVNPGSQAEACAAVEQWEAKKAQTKGD